MEGLFSLVVLAKMVETTFLNFGVKNKGL